MQQPQQQADQAQVDLYGPSGATGLGKPSGGGGRSGRALTRAAAAASRQPPPRRPFVRFPSAKDGSPVSCRCRLRGHSRGARAPHMRHGMSGPDEQQPAAAVAFY